MFMACMGVINGTLTVGDVVFLNTVLAMAYAPLFNLGNMYIRFQESLVELKDVVNLMNLKNSVVEKPDAKALEWSKGRIVFDNISYRYENRELLKDFSLEIEPGTTLLITGKSGIGKSTLISLLMRFWEPQAGRILVDGQDIKDVTFKSLRSQIGFCPQTAIFFNSSVLSNLLYSNIDKYFEKRDDGQYSMKQRGVPAEVKETLSDLGLLDHILSLEEGFDYKMGDQGTAFSGGERQRLSIARTVLKGGHVNLFDEPTNGLDAFNEQLFLRTLEKQKKLNKINIIVTHNLNLAKHCDKVLYLKEDTKYELGGHSELLADESRDYRRLYQAFLMNQHQHRGSSE